MRLISLAGWKTDSEEASTPDSLQAPTAPPGLGPSVSLHAIRTRATPVEWHEAVAIAQGVCRSLLDSGDLVGPARLELIDVFVDATGRVGVAPNGPGNAAHTIQQIGWMASQLLPDHDFLHLRERFVAKAISSPPAYHSLLELSQALEYYERPNRAELIQAVYRRWEKGPAAERAAPPVARFIPPPPAAPNSRRREFVLFAGAALGILIVIAGIGAWMLTSPRAAAIGSLITSSLTPDRAQPPPAPPIDEALPPKQVVKTGRRMSARLEQPTPPPPGAESDSSEPVVVEDPSAVPSPAADALQTPESVASGPEGPATEVVEDLALHSVSDTDITPPRLLYPQTITSVFAGMRRQNFMVIQVVVNNHGLVESVKAKDVPRTLGESVMLLNALSSVKTWRFEPALKQDEPVRYDHLVALPVH